MKILAILVFHLIRAWALSLVPSGRRRLIAENLVLKQQLLVMHRGKKRSPNLKTIDRIVLGSLVPWLRKSRLERISVLWRPETIIRFHQALVKKKYQWLFSNKNPRLKTGPKGPSDELIQIILEMKKRNPRYGYHRIAMQIYQSYGFEVDKHVVRRVLQQYYKPSPPERGQSWLAFLGHTKDSLWSVDFFRCESIRLKTYYVMIAIDQHTRSIIGFAITAGFPDGNAACRMFNQVIGSHQAPQYLSSDNDPLFKYHRWQANLRVLEIEEIKTIPGTPVSHPFVERTIGSVRREFLDRTLFWNERDLARKLEQYRIYFNETRGHTALAGKTPTKYNIEPERRSLSGRIGWKKHCRGLFQTPFLE